MPADPPIDFEALAKRGGAPGTGGYPYTIASRDLMKNFVFATLDTEAGMVESTAGRGGHTQRKLRISPGTATGQLAYWDGERWVPSATPSGKSLLQWTGDTWALIPAPAAAGQVFYWTGSEWSHLSAPPSTGTRVLGAVGGQIQWIETEAC